MSWLDMKPYFGAKLLKNKFMAKVFCHELLSFLLFFHKKRTCSLYISFVCNIQFAKS